MKTRNEVLLPCFQHGVGDPVEDDIRVAPHHTLVLVEGNYLLIGAPVAGLLIGKLIGKLDKQWRTTMGWRPSTASLLNQCRL